MKKEYHIPMTEVTFLATDRLMTMGDTSGHIGGGSTGQAPARISPVPQGAVKSF